MIQSWKVHVPGSHVLSVYWDVAMLTCCVSFVILYMSGIYVSPWSGSSVVLFYLGLVSLYIMFEMFNVCNKLSIVTSILHVHCLPFVQVLHTVLVNVCFRILPAGLVISLSFCVYFLFLLLWRWLLPTRNESFNWNSAWTQFPGSWRHCNIAAAFPRYSLAPAQLHAAFPAVLGNIARTTLISVVNGQARVGACIAAHLSPLRGNPCRRSFPTRPARDVTMQSLRWRHHEWMAIALQGWVNCAQYIRWQSVVIVTGKASYAMTSFFLKKKFPEISVMFMS